MGKCYASTVISLCRQENGYQEKKSNSQLEDKTANAGSNNFNKYAAFIDTNYPDFYNGKKNGYEWCDVYVDCMMIRAYGLDDALRLTCQPKKSLGAGVRYSYNYYKNAGRISDKPIPGAQCFFGDKAKSTYSHTGIVIAVGPSSVTVSEGNSSNMVREKTYSITDSSILGYGIPDYDAETTAEKGTVEIDASKYSKIIINIK